MSQLNWLRRSATRRQIAKNLMALVILQGGNYLLPLILIPFLVRTLGMEKFGDWVFAMSFVAIFRTLVAYGFDLTATRAVSVARNNVVRIGELYMSILTVRLLLFAVSCLLLIAIASVFSGVAKVVDLALVSMLVLVGEAFFPVWLFQGMESMSTITKLRLGYKFAHIVAVVLLVHGPEGVLLVSALDAIGSLIAGLLATHLAFSAYKLPFKIPRFHLVWEQLRDGWGVFISNVAVHLYTTINTVLLGTTLGPIAVAQYAIADKAYHAVRGMAGTLVQALFPMLSRTYENDNAAYAKMARTATIVFGGAMAILSVVLTLAADWIVIIISGAHDVDAVRCLQILGLSLCFAMGGLFSSFLVVEKRSNALVTVTWLTMAANCLVILPALSYFGVVGAAIAFLVTQVFHLAAQIVANRVLLFSR